jgi:hypothetical protein
MKRFVVCGYNNELILAKVEAVTAESREKAVDKTDGVKAWDYQTVIVMTEAEARRIGRCGETKKRRKA